MTKGNSNQLAYGNIAKDVLALTAGLGAGAGLMYFFDPSRGRARRGRLIAEASGLFHRDEHKLEKRAKDLLNRARGVVVEVAAAFNPEEHVTDEVLVERVRSRMGHLVSNPQIQVHALDGVVTLEGKLTHAERRRLRNEVKAIPGVRRVNDRLTHPFAFAPGLLAGLAAGIALFSKASGPRAN